MSNQNLGPQFMDHATLGDLEASDYNGKVAEGVAPMQHWQDMFGDKPGFAHEYDEGDSPASKVERLRGEIRDSGGVQKPLTVVNYPDIGNRIMDGHHRAVAAYLEGKGAPAEVLSVAQFTKKLYG